MPPRLKLLPPRVSAVDARTVQTIEKTSRRFYLTPDWRTLVTALLKERGRRCEDARHDPFVPRTGVRIYGDHIVELSDGGAPLDPSNVMLMCGACHNRKTAEARLRRTAPVG